MNKINFCMNNMVDKYFDPQTNTVNAFVYNGDGYESNIYRYQYNDRIVLFKKFKKQYIKRSFMNYKYEKYLEEVPEEVFINKEKKLQLMSECDALKDEVKLLDLVYEGDNFIGYTMEKENMEQSSHFYSTKTKILILKELRKKIEVLNKNGIYILDYNRRNILFDKKSKTIKLCDLDNLKIGDLDNDLKHNFRKKYEKVLEDDIDYNKMESFCFNLFTYYFLTKIVPYSSENVDDIAYYELPRYLKTDKNLELVKSIRHLNKKYRCEYLIDNVKKGIFS